MSHQWHADHARCLAALWNAVLFTGVLLAGANLTFEFQKLKSTAPSQITMIGGVHCLQVPGGEYATPLEKYQRRYLHICRTDCSEL